MPNTILICRHNKNGTGYCEHIGSYCVEGPCTAEELIEYAPVRHGRWIKDGDVVCCSECGEEHAWDEYRATYCDVCGAKMDKEE